MMGLNFSWLIGVAIVLFLVLAIWSKVSRQTMGETIRDIIDMFKGE